MALFQEIVRNQCGKFGGLDDPLTREEQFAIGKKMCGGIGLERMGLLDLAAAAWDMHFGLADFNIRKVGGGRFEDRIIGFAGLAGRQPIGHDGTGAVGEFLIVGVADVLNGAHCQC